MRASRIVGLGAASLVAVAALGGTIARTAGATAQPAIKWGPAPSVFPAGAQLAVMAGDPSSTGEFTVRLKMPNGYKIAPHTHPTDEHVTVISGSFRVGMGATAKREGMLTLAPGGFVTAPAGHAHYAEAHGETIVQVNAMGPFALTYVDPKDTPKVGSR